MPPVLGPCTAVARSPSTIPALQLSTHPAKPSASNPKSSTILFIPPPHPIHFPSLLPLTTFYSLLSFPLHLTSSRPATSIIHDPLTILSFLFHTSFLRLPS